MQWKWKLKPSWGLCPGTDSYMSSWCSATLFSLARELFKWLFSPRNHQSIAPLSLWSMGSSWSISWLSSWTSQCWVSQLPSKLAVCLQGPVSYISAWLSKFTTFLTWFLSLSFREIYEYRFITSTSEYCPNCLVLIILCRSSFSIRSGCPFPRPIYNTQWCQVARLSAWLSEIPLWSGYWWTSSTTSPNFNWNGYW